MSNMTLLIEVAICLGFIFFFYQCCIKGARARNNRHGPSDNHDRGPTHNASAIDNEDLRRFRERLSERHGERSSRTAGTSNNSASTIAARKELIEKNLFSRQINREDSVKELAKLLAISRGGAVVDEELGGVAAAGTPVESTTPAPAKAKHEPDCVQPDEVPISATSDSTMPEPSAPPPPAAEATTTTVDTIATALSAEQQQKQHTPSSDNNESNQPTITLAPIRNLWTNLTQNNQTNITTNTTEAPRNNNMCIPTSNNFNNPLHTMHKLECSICLEQYSPNDTISWAKDGGDAPTLSSLNAVSINGNESGCDHIFHRGCLVAWLQDHDECPLCRRKVVHADADVRFANWAM